MKAYLFNTKTGLYEGETFEEPAILQHEDGLTTITPPDYGHGQVPVFNLEKKSWELIPLAVVRQLLYSSSLHSEENPA